MRHLLLAVTLIGVASPASAALIDRGSGMIYDDVLDITWLQDANYAMTSGFDADGRMTWSDSVDWASNLVFGGFDDWRLPSMNLAGDNNVIDCSFSSEAACRDNELGYMHYHNLGGVMFTDLTGDQGLFMNIQLGHWSNTEWIFPGEVWMFDFFRGIQGVAPTFAASYAWAVRDGDVGAAVPIPPAFWLFGSALAGLVTASRRR